MAADSEQAFSVSHPDWQDWVDMLEWHLQYEHPLSVGNVMDAMVSEGFIITPPARRRYVVRYHGKPVFEMDEPGDAAHLGPFYTITDTKEGGSA